MPTKGCPRPDGPPCIVMHDFIFWFIPFHQQMAGKMDNVVFLKVDVDEAEDVAGEYNISAMPTFVFLKDGKKVRAVCACQSVYSPQKEDYISNLNNFLIFEKRGWISIAQFCGDSFHSLMLMMTQHLYYRSTTWWAPMPTSWRSLWTSTAHKLWTFSWRGVKSKWDYSE